MKKLAFIVITLFFLTGCSEVKTTDPQEVYMYWSGSEAPENLQLVNGQYWGSSNWSREYIMYLKIRPTRTWEDEFISQNKLQVEKGDWYKPTDTPTWFDPTENSVMYSSGDDFDQGSRYFKDTLTGDFYIYEIQL